MGEGGHKLQKRRLPWGLSSHRRSEETGGGRGAIKFKKWGDVFYGWSLTENEDHQPPRTAGRMLSLELDFTPLQTRDQATCRHLSFLPILYHDCFTLLKINSSHSDGSPVDHLPYILGGSNVDC